MTDDRGAAISVVLFAVDPPFKPEHGVAFGLQHKRGEVDPVPATSTSAFEFQLEIFSNDAGTFDFRGDYVNGRRGDRFVYLSWGVPGEAEPFVMFARAKIKLGDIPTELLQAAVKKGTDLECRLEATNAKGQPASGTIRPPAVGWAPMTPPGSSDVDGGGGT
ncbi:MAG: DUF5990 family protein [Acidimicrobiales bacterium]